MKTKLLLPNPFKWIGCVLIFLSIALWVVRLTTDREFSFLNLKTFALANGEVFGKSQYFSIVEMNMDNTLIGVLFILGGLFIAFAREKIEDEFVMQLRLNSFKWAVLINYSILLLLYMFVHGTYFLMVMVYNMFTVLALFILHFNYTLFKNRIHGHEE